MIRQCCIIRGAVLIVAALLAVNPVTVSAEETSTHTVPLEPEANPVTVPTEETSTHTVPLEPGANPVTASAEGTNTYTVPLEPERTDIVSVELPAGGDEAREPFDFILDPNSLIYMTHAAKYGGVTVEEGATLLFENSDGEYGFSKCSDKKTVKNKSTVPVKVTVTAKIEGLGEIKTAKGNDFSGNKEACIYLALVDDRGNEQPISLDEGASVEIVLNAAPDSAYAYHFNEETKSYDYKQVVNPDFDTYSFGLTGACNTNAKWDNISMNPVVTVTWKTEILDPAETEDDSNNTQTEQAPVKEENTENTLPVPEASENSVDNVSEDNGSENNEGQNTQKPDATVNEPAKEDESVEEPNQKGEPVKEPDQKNETVEESSQKNEPVNEPTDIQGTDQKE